MSVRVGVINCSEPECNVRVAEGQVTDYTWVWEIKLDQSVTDAPALSHGMGIGGFNTAVVTHSVVDGAVQHQIVRRPAVQVG